MTKVLIVSAIALLSKDKELIPFYKFLFLFFFFTLLACSKVSKDFIVFNKDVKTSSRIDNPNSNVLEVNKMEDFFGDIIDLKGYKILSVQQENLNLDVYFEQVVLAQNFSNLNAYLFIIGFDPKIKAGTILFKTQIDIDPKNSYNMYLEDITGDYDFNIVIQGFLKDKSVLYVFQKSVLNDVSSYRPIFFDKVNGTVLINKYARSSAYEENRSRESYPISLEKYEKVGEDLIISKIEKYEYSHVQGRYYLSSVSEKVGKIDNNIYKTLKNLSKDEVYKFLHGVWYDVHDYNKMHVKDIDEVLFLSFERQSSEINLFRKNSQEVAKIEYISKPAYNTLNVSAKSLFSDLIVYNFWIKIVDKENIEIKIDTSTNSYDNSGFSGTFKRFDENVLNVKKGSSDIYFIPSGNYVYKDKIYDFSYPHLTYIDENKIYYGIFNIFPLKNNFVLEYEIDMGSYKLVESFFLEHSERIVQKQKFSTIILNPIKILKDDVSLVKGQKLKLERIEKI
ncbi:pallilysin-related adhesin [Borreliella burgdorferi]|uniref:pallilysin-related adhesin n=1 Tax=Borreliella burgdorferi TaxID=139 RepID=UPI00017F3496|nr:pallilysin-related adhesin [Borreliella burgdorferi]MCD2374193.1 pallilysin-related adhesin [Borreliella burgdorferi]MCD2383273.1 pallilysin-related adhesin [Borreliella burgdorferi]MCD2384658.1 pallilysin-related adhesin [Borreliella burgdorferi]MCD2389756.1 pallilysin-related adhesin [Borreliella burgdorferi]MCD2393307.1 pallilysin-related adhesin [Borreliella burgdorferi]